MYERLIIGNAYFGAKYVIMGPGAAAAWWGLIRYLGRYLLPN